MKINLTEHINTHIGNTKENIMEQLTPEELILAFFYAGPDRDKRNPEISGTLMLTKQFFVFIKEIKPIQILISNN